MQNNTKDKEKQKIKSLAKAVGLKSTLVSDNNYVLVAFDNVNAGDVVRIEDAKNNEVLLEKNEPIKTKINEKNIWVSNDKMSASVNKPDVDHVGMDNLGLKSRIEKYVFDKEFPNDNVHIQIAHNILDVKKILAPYTNDIIGSMNNIVNMEQDVLGQLYTLTNREEQKRSGKVKATLRDDQDKFITRLSRYADFYEGAFKKVPSKDDENFDKKEQIMDYNFDVLRFIGHVRQCVFHNINKNANSVFGDAIYNFKQNIPDDLIELTEKNFQRDIHKVLNSFWRTQGVNLCILIRLYNAGGNYQQERKLMKGLFDFVVKKENKNIGLNITSVREEILKNYMTSSLAKKYDTIRGKLYQIYDYVIYDYLISNNDIINDTVTSLRQVMTEEDKAQVYINLANKIWSQNSKKFKSAEYLTVNVSTTSRNSKINKRQYEDMIDILNIDLNVSNFVKMINMVCKFLDKKEINELLSDLINKFDNIADLIDICKSSDVNIDIRFKNDFVLFINSRKVASDLQIIKSIARMKNTDSTLPVYQGLEILGVDKELIKSEKFAKPTDKRNRENTSIRNFVYNSVVASKQFKYLVKYISPRECPTIARNKSLVGYIVNGLPDKQIQRYYKVLNIAPNAEINVAKEIITDRIVDIYGGQKFQSILESVTDKGKQNAQALVELYLTVIYIFVKNMIKINSSYTMAYYAYERDRFFKLGIPAKNQNIYDLAMLKEYYDKISPKNRKCVDANMKIFNSSYKNYINMATVMRNSIDHLNAVMMIPRYINDIKFDSYYSTYHYIVQKSVIALVSSTINEVDSLKAMTDNVLKYKRYSKDMLKVLMLPLAYNQSRYKNLVTEVLYNRYFGWNPEKDYRNN